MKLQILYIKIFFEKFKKNIYLVKKEKKHYHYLLEYKIYDVMSVKKVYEKKKVFFQDQKSSRKNKFFFFLRSKKLTKKQDFDHF